MAVVYNYKLSPELVLTTAANTDIDAAVVHSPIRGLIRFIHILWCHKILEQAQHYVVLLAAICHGPVPEHY